MAQIAAHFRAKQEIFGYLAHPPGERLLAGQFVKAIVDLRNVEMSGIKCQVFRRFYLRRIEYFFPVLVAPPRSADMYVSLHFHFQFVVVHDEAIIVPNQSETRSGAKRNGF